MNEFEVHWEAVKLLQSLGCLSHIIVSHTVPLKAGIHKQLHVCILNVPPGQKFNSFSDSIRIGELKFQIVLINFNLLISSCYNLKFYTNQYLITISSLYIFENF